MNKEELLQELYNKINVGEINKEEVMQGMVLNTKKFPVQNAIKVQNSYHLSITNLLYIVGAIIAVVGMTLFAYQAWDSLGSLGRISITLLLGLLLTFIGFFLSKEKEENTIGTVFYFMGGMLIPFGSVVALHEFIGYNNLSWPLALTFGMIFIFYLLLNYAKKNIILTFFTIANATSFIYLVVHAITDGLFNNYTNVYTYLTMVIGVCYILLAYSFSNNWNKKLIPILYFFGFFGLEFSVLFQHFGLYDQYSLWSNVFSLGLVFIFCLWFNFYVKNSSLTLLTIINGTGFLYAFVGAILNSSAYTNDIYIYLHMIVGLSYLLLSYSFLNTRNKNLTEILNFFGTFSLLASGFSKIFGSLPWQLFYPILVIGGFGFSIYARSRSILIISTISLLSYFSYITGEYFANSLGWPIALVILGFLFIGLGYISINIHKKYIQQ